MEWGGGWGSSVEWGGFDGKGRGMWEDSRGNIGGCEVCGDDGGVGMQGFVRGDIEDVGWSWG